MPKKSDSQKPDQTSNHDKNNQPPVPQRDIETRYAPSSFDEGRTTAMPGHSKKQPRTESEDEGKTAYMPPGPNIPTVVSPKPGLDETVISSSGISGTDQERQQPLNLPTRVTPEASQTQTEQDNRATITTGRILQDRYRLDKILGRGGFGAAYLAEDVKLKRSCVVKQMLTPKGASAQDVALYQANFAREASLLVQLNHPGHPNIPEIYDYFSDSGGNYLVMKYIEGPSLRGVIEQSEGKIPWREAVRYMTDVCNALNYMHTHGKEPIMHRDIKPANILLGNDNRVWLVDFGLAKAQPVKSSGDLMATQAAGSLGYTPLEQWLGEAVPTSDVYAAGATLHFLVTGQSPSQPFGGEFNVQKLKDMHGNFTPIRKLDKGLPPTLEAVINRATAANTNHRLTALQAKEQLEALLSGAQAAALYTFKNGESARSVRELVDMCDKNRQEAQEYLYHGDFQRWFRMINRNDLAEAAEQAVKQGKNEKDGLEKFLKLILPNLVLRRMGRVTKNLARVAILLMVIFIVVGVLLIAAGTYAMKGFTEQTISNYPWNFNTLNLAEPNNFSEEDVNQGAEAIVGAYLDEFNIDMRPSNIIEVNAIWNGLPINIPVELKTIDGLPNFYVSKVNQIPLFFLSDSLSESVNTGIAHAFEDSPVDIAQIEVTENKVMVKVIESKHRGRPSLPTATPTPTVTPLPTATPTVTPTPEGLALVTIFNETGEEIILKIDGESIEMGIDDSKAIEMKPGTYNYSVTFKETGSIGAEGQKTWTVKTYKWRVGGSVEQNE